MVLDDVLQQAIQNDDVVQGFSSYSHHFGITYIFLTQNIFARGKHFRTISLNSHYFILFKNRRDQLQIQTLAKQMFPSSVKYFMDAFHKSTDPPYGYLVVDCHPKSNPRYKLRTHILPGQLTSVFVPAKST